MDDISPGIVLHTHPYSETSLVVRWLTPHHGRLATLARGARRPKSPFRGKIDLCFHCEFTFNRSRRSQLHTLRELRLVKAHPSLRRDWRALQLVAYATTLIERATETETPLPVLFELLAALLDHLDHHPPSVAALLAFELGVLIDLGLRPPLAASSSSLSAGAREVARLLSPARWDQVHRITPSAPQVAELDRFLRPLLAEPLGAAIVRRARTLEGLAQVGTPFRPGP